LLLAENPQESAHEFFDVNFATTICIQLLKQPLRFMGLESQFRKSDAGFLVSHCHAKLVQRYHSASVSVGSLKQLLQILHLPLLVDMRICTFVASCKLLSSTTDWLSADTQPQLVTCANLAELTLQRAVSSRPELPRRLLVPACPQVTMVLDHWLKRCEATTLDGGHTPVWAGSICMPQESFGPTRSSQSRRTPRPRIAEW